MLLRNRPPKIDAAAPANRPNPPFEHVPSDAVAVLRWLNAHRVDFVVVGPVARSVRGAGAVTGPVSVVPAPYGRNLDRLARALGSVKAVERIDSDPTGPGRDATAAVRIAADQLVRTQRWTLRCGEHDLDIEGRSADAPRYQELLYESVRVTLADDVSVEIASPEDIEHYDHVRRTGRAPEMTVRRV